MTMGLVFLVAILAAGLLLYAVVVTGGNRRRRKPYRGGPSSHGSRGFADPAETRARWELVMATSKTGASGLKSAINEADKLYDYTLKQLGYDGGTMGDRLKASKSRYSSYQVYDAVWRAHKLRNSLAHDVGFDLVVSQANEALRDFERGLKDLGAL